VAAVRAHAFAQAQKKNSKGKVKVLKELKSNPATPTPAKKVNTALNP